MTTQTSYRIGDLVTVEVKYHEYPGRIIGFDPCQGYQVLYGTSYQGLDGLMHPQTATAFVPAKRLTRRTA